MHNAEHWEVEAAELVFMYFPTTKKKGNCQEEEEGEAEAEVCDRMLKL